MAEEIGEGKQAFALGLPPHETSTSLQSVETRDSPPPVKAFWSAEKYPVAIEGKGTLFVRLELEPPRRFYSLPSPVNPQNKYPEAVVRN